MAKEILSKESYDVGAVALTNIGRRTASDLSNVHQDETETIALDFMVSLMATDEFASNSDLRSRTGLRYYD